VRLALGVDQQIVRAFLAIEDGALACVFRVVLGVTADARGIFLSTVDGVARDAVAAGEPVQPDGNTADD
jgi:hypothetical protein